MKNMLSLGTNLLFKQKVAGMIYRGFSNKWYDIDIENLMNFYLILFTQKIKI